MKTAQIRLGYYKQGDDLRYHLSQHELPQDALEAHAVQLEDDAAHLRRIKEAIQIHEVDFNADTHCIQITGPDELIDRLLNSGDAETMFGEDDEGEYEEGMDDSCEHGNPIDDWDFCSDEDVMSGKRNPPLFHFVCDAHGKPFDECEICSHDEDNSPAKTKALNDSSFAGLDEEVMHLSQTQKENKNENSEHPDKQR